MTQRAVASGAMRAVLVLVLLGGNEASAQAADPALVERARALLRGGYSNADVQKVAGRNHLRAMRQMEKVAAELGKTEAAFSREGAPKPE